MTVLGTFLSSVWFILPAYAANMTPVVAGGGRPIDGGRKFVDGKPLLGPGKTVRGFCWGLLVGFCVGLVQALLHSPLETHLTLLFGSPLETVLGGLLLSLGAMVGDLAGSFFKRRAGVERGEPFPLLDQLDFVIGALLLSLPLVLPRLTWEILAILFLLTPPLHLLTNYAGYRMGLKDRPY
ncbi:MAG: CDP-2,3-bis-(O-geranylgeranyl)-sn-glycerol synthase [Hadesarchaea archaeon]|nr:MAG: CDP-2,3-bis-(O-geranylgeranyl)-sn-glycerol synthase [Hadesarchaea archaeon]TDA34688.1 MAG: CDP-2,3-bis-(O-geranylgeranyl)-sn-glycerol synthase [Hadesarchaea archaeon]